MYSRRPATSGSGDGWTSSDTPESEIFPGLTVVILVILGLLIGWKEAAKERIGRLKMARVFVVLAVVLFCHRRLAVVLRALEARHLWHAAVVGGHAAQAAVGRATGSGASPVRCTRLCGPPGAVDRR